MNEVLLQTALRNTGIDDGKGGREISEVGLKLDIIKQRTRSSPIIFTPCAPLLSHSPANTANIRFVVQWLNDPRLQTVTLQTSVSLPQFSSHSRLFYKLFKSKMDTKQTS